MSPAAHLVQLKAFGDLVIASSAIGQVVPEQRARVALLIGEHLRPLCDAVAPALTVMVLPTGETGVPSLFDARRNGLPAALRSAWTLRSAMAHARRTMAGPLVFDRLGWRERLVAGRSPVLDLPSAENIYQGYDLMLSRLDIRLLDSLPVPEAAGRRRRIGIFPGSRLAPKNLPSALVREVLDLSAAVSDADLFLLDGERPDLEQSGLPYTAVPRDFATLVAHVRSLDAIISADSLPAHLAEALGKPVFVLTPRPNLYWMPRSVWREDRWGLFGAVDLAGRVTAFVRGASGC